MSKTKESLNTLDKNRLIMKKNETRLVLYATGGLFLGYIFFSLAIFVGSGIKFLFMILSFITFVSVLGILFYKAMLK